MIAQKCGKSKARVSQKRPTHDQELGASMAAPSPSFQTDATQIKIVRDRGNLLAFLDVDFYLGSSRVFLMRGVRVVKQNDGTIYCQLPHQKSERDGRFYPIICAYDKRFREAIQSAALTAYHNATSDVIVQLAMNLDTEVPA